MELCVQCIVHDLILYSVYACVRGECSGEPTLDNAQDRMGISLFTFTISAVVLRAG